jgi:hypothetical protein
VSSSSRNASWQIASWASPPQAKADLPENTRAELRRHLARLRVVREQIHAIEQERLRKLAAAPAEDKGPHAMVCSAEDGSTPGPGVRGGRSTANPAAGSPGLSRTSTVE